MLANQIAEFVIGKLTYNSTSIYLKTFPYAPLRDLEQIYLYCKALFTVVYSKLCIAYISFRETKYFCHKRLAAVLYHL